MDCTVTVGRILMSLTLGLLGSGRLLNAPPLLLRRQMTSSLFSQWDSLGEHARSFVNHVHIAHKNRCNPSRSMVSSKFHREMAEAALQYAGGSVEVALNALLSGVPLDTVPRCVDVVTSIGVIDHL